MNAIILKDATSTTLRALVIGRLLRFRRERPDKFVAVDELFNGLGCDDPGERSCAVRLIRSNLEKNSSRFRLVYGDYRAEEGTSAKTHVRIKRV